MHETPRADAAEAKVAYRRSGGYEADRARHSDLGDCESVARALSVRHVSGLPMQLLARGLSPRGQPLKGRLRSAFTQRA